MARQLSRIAVIVLALWMLFQTQMRLTLAQTDEPDSAALPVECAGIPDLVPAAPGDGVPIIHIVQPVSDDTIYGSAVEVQVATENFDFGNGGHWHIWIDRQMAGMLYEGGALVSMAPGIHQICAILGDANHFNLGFPDGITITVAEAAEGTPTQTVTSPNAVPPQQEGRSTNIALVLGAGLLAVVAGWWVGKRLPKR